MSENAIKPGVKSKSELAVVIMAAGKGTRLKTRRPKVLHEIGGKSLLSHVIAAASQFAETSNIFVIVGINRVVKRHGLIRR